MRRVWIDPSGRRQRQPLLAQSRPPRFFQQPRQHDFHTSRAIGDEGEPATVGRRRRLPLVPGLAGQRLGRISAIEARDLEIRRFLPIPVSNDERGSVGQESPLNRRAGQQQPGRPRRVHGRHEESLTFAERALVRERAAVG